MIDKNVAEVLSLSNKEKDKNRGIRKLREGRGKGTNILNEPSCFSGISLSILHCSAH